MPVFIFTSADALADRLIYLHHQTDPKLHTVILDFEGINFIDTQGSYTLAEIIELASSRDIELRLTRIKTDVKELLQRDGIIDRLGEESIYGNIYEAAANQIPQEVR